MTVRIFQSFPFLPFLPLVAGSDARINGQKVSSWEWIDHFVSLSCHGHTPPGPGVASEGAGGAVWIRNWGCACFCYSSLEYQLGCILFSSSVVPVRPSSTCESSSCKFRLVSFSASSSRASCPRCSPPSSIPHPLPHHSHVSLMYFLVAFIALSSSTHRVPRCSNSPPDAHFHSSFLPFVHVKLVSGSWRQLGCIPLPSFQWAWDKELVLTREKKKGSSAYYWSEWNFFWAVDRAPTTSLHDSAVMFKALSLSSLTLLLPWFLTRETAYVALLRAWSHCGVKVLIPASQTTKVAQLCPWNVSFPPNSAGRTHYFMAQSCLSVTLKKNPCSVSACSSSFCDLHIKTGRRCWHLTLKRCLDSSEKRAAWTSFCGYFCSIQIPAVSHFLHARHSCPVGLCRKTDVASLGKVSLTINQGEIWFFQGV